MSNNMSKMSNNNEQQNNGPPRTEDQIQLPRVFNKKIYVLCASFAVVVLIQCLILFKPMRNNDLLAYFVGYIGLCLLVSCLIISLCYPSTLMKFPVNWIFIGVVVEAFTCVMVLCVEIAPGPFCAIVAINIIAMAAIVVITSIKSCDLTKYGVWLNVIGVFVLVSFVAILVIIVYVRLGIAAILYCILILVLMILYTIYYIKLTHGKCYKEMELNQVPFAALLQFCSFMIQNVWMMGLYIWSETPNGV